MQIVVGIGTNQGNRAEEIRLAIKFLSQFGSVIKARIFECPPFGFESETDFLNTAVLLDTKLDAFDLLRYCLDYEIERGRNRSVHSFSDRPIDLDLLIAGDLVISESELQLPHPFLSDRIFAILPTADLVPDWVHPRLGKTIEEILDQCRDTTKIDVYVS